MSCADCDAVMCTCWWIRAGWGARSHGRICMWCGAKTIRTGRGPSPVDSGLFRSPIGAPMRPDAIGELMAAASRRARFDTPVRPHQLRHAYGSNVADAGAGIDVVADLLGHATVSSSQIYVHPDSSRMRAAVDAVPSPREQPGGSR